MPGSVDFEDVRKILDQKPILSKYLTGSLEFEETGEGLRLGPQFPHLGGTRIGPYEFLAKPKGAPGGFLLKTIFNTIVFFIDSEGNESEEINLEAVAVREVMNSVEISEI